MRSGCMGEQKKNSGCVKAAIVVGVLVLIVVPALVLGPAMWFRAAKKEQRWEEMQGSELQRARVDGTVVFQKDAVPQYAPHRRGEELKREHFVALMIDDLATELARKEMQKTANGAEVRWLLETGDIFDSDGVVHGQFTLPYEIVSGRSTRGSAVNLTCEFLPESKEELLMVRRGDWVIVEGKLSFDGRKAEITEARIVDEKTPPRAERP